MPRAARPRSSTGQRAGRSSGTSPPPGMGAGPPTRVGSMTSAMSSATTVSASAKIQPFLLPLFTGTGLAPAGAVLSTVVLAVVTLLPGDAFLVWGWRIPFLLSAVLVGIGLYVRLKVTESPLFEQEVITAVAAEKKRPLPRFPRRIGVVTSATGAAVHDIIRTIQRRLPTPILIADCAVQGPNAPHQIVNGMAMVVRAGVDVVIVGRGGGSADDLAAFNDERVVRSLFACPIPTVSAVGHETDWTLCDLVADLRAPTPSAAAEMVSPSIIDLFDEIDDLTSRLGDAAERQLTALRRSAGISSR